MTDWVVSNHVTFIPVGEEGSPELPQPVIPPEPSWLVQEGDGQIPALQLVDESFDSRLTLWERFLNFLFPGAFAVLAETNMINPNRPVENGRVAIFSKTITNLNNKPIWIEWITDCIGARNAENFPTPGDGNCDTGAWKLMDSTYGGNLRNVKEIILQNGTKYCVLEAPDFAVIPEKREDGWYYRGEKLTYRSHPYLFNVRTNRKRSNVDTWLTAGGINISNDVGTEGGKGHEAWPPVTDTPGAQRLMDMWLYPALPAEMIVYANSLIVDGDLVDPDEKGQLCEITKYRFHGPDTYGFDDVSGNWYKLSEMLVRGTLENRDGGNGFDWRCYARELMPSRRTCPAGDCGWLRPNG